jgi:hypothetical protein
LTFGNHRAERGGSLPSGGGSGQPAQQSPGGVYQTEGSAIKALAFVVERDAHRLLSISPNERSADQLESLRTILKTICRPAQSECNPKELLKRGKPGSINEYTIIYEQKIKLKSSKKENLGLTDVEIDEIVKLIDVIRGDQKKSNGNKSAVDGPLNAITHQVSFIVVMSLSATPTWSLMRFKGPGGASSIPGAPASTGTTAPATGTSGSFASVSQTDIHQLTITLGKGVYAQRQQEEHATASLIGIGINAIRPTQ